MDQNNIERDKLSYAVDILKNGGLVAFPTETVYGLGSDALNGKAVDKIFKAKGRPSDNPLIIHIAANESVCDLVSEIPTYGARLVNKFWPGPLTLVFKKSSIVPKEITAGLETVAIRMPSHPIALALIEESGFPLAAPSANSSGKPSPTLATHVIEDLSGKIDLIIDGGATNLGLESTVLDITTSPPTILRPGAITLEQLKEELGDVILEFFTEQKDKEDLTLKSPGLKYKHYSPKANLIVVEGHTDNIINKINTLAYDYINKGIKVAVLATDQTKDYYRVSPVISMGDRDHPHRIASNLFNCFRELDHQNVDLVFAESVNKTGIGLAIMNRIGKASGYNIIKA